MIHEVSGDILLTGAQAVAHGIAPHDHFNQGLALSLREEWPSLAKDFRHFCHTETPKPGEIWVWKGTNGKFIVNLITQEGNHEHGNKPGKAKIEYVNRSLKLLSKFLAEEEIASVALPRLATGVGGLAWEDVLPLIKTHLGQSGAEVFIYTTFKKGLKADEKAA